MTEVNLSKCIYKKPEGKVYALAIDWMMSHGPIATDNVQIYADLLAFQKIEMTEEKTAKLNSLLQSKITSSVQPEG